MMEDKNMITLLVPCRWCHEEHEIEVDVDDYFNFTIGQNALEAFPYLFPWQREMFISHTCPTCWKKMMAGQPDEEVFASDEDGFITLSELDIDDFIEKFF